MTASARSSVRHIDRSLWIAVLALVAMGLVMVYSSSFILASERFKDGLYFFKRQFAYAILGGSFFFIARKIQRETFEKIAKPLLFISFALVLSTLIPGIGHRAGGASRWISIFGFSFQPAELAKFSVILFLSRQIAQKLPSPSTYGSVRQEPNWNNSFLMYFVAVAPLYGALLLQPDFGTCFILISTTLFMLWGSGTKKRYFFGALGIATLLGAILIAVSPYRKARILAFLNPWADPTNKGFQVIQSFVALHEGGIFGVGLGNSKEKLFFLPEAHNDFIFSVIAEELGMFGVVLVILLFLTVLRAGVRAALQTQNRFERSLAIGITSFIGLQAFSNMGVVTGLLPTKGFPLPLVSFGGSSMIVTMFMLGVLSNILERNPTLGKVNE